MTLRGSFTQRNTIAFYTSILPSAITNENMFIGVIKSNIELYIN